jgi:hypothetical protein
MTRKTAFFHQNLFFFPLGLIILSSKFTLACIEGPEDIVGRFVKQIANDDFLEASKIILIYNNMNQSFFRKIIWRFAELPSTVEKIPMDEERVELMTKELVKKIYKLCKFVRDEEADECKLRLFFYCTSNNFDSSKLLAFGPRICHLIINLQHQT